MCSRLIVSPDFSFRGVTVEEKGRIIVDKQLETRMEEDLSLTAPTSSPEYFYDAPTRSYVHMNGTLATVPAYLIYPRRS